MAINVAHLEMGQFGATHAGAIERHQQRPSKQGPGGVDETRPFLPAQHRWQSPLVLRLRQKIAELMALKCLDEKEAQGRDLLITVPGVSLRSRSR
ncbi:MAG TPA: hypothetical protein VMX38_05755 [Verrucomicrobiae bacterium]|nr:hypothetical protein [Verrucomicrobiae bacterium]